MSTHQKVLLKFYSMNFFKSLTVYLAFLINYMKMSSVKVITLMKTHKKDVLCIQIKVISLPRGNSGVIFYPIDLYQPYTGITFSQLIKYH